MADNMLKINMEKQKRELDCLIYDDNFSDSVEANHQKHMLAYSLGNRCKISTTNIQVPTWTPFNLPPQNHSIYMFTENNFAMMSNHFMPIENQTEASQKMLYQSPYIYPKTNQMQLQQLRNPIESGNINNTGNEVVDNILTKFYVNTSDGLIVMDRILTLPDNHKTRILVDEHATKSKLRTSNRVPRKRQSDSIILRNENSFHSEQVSVALLGIGPQKQILSDRAKIVKKFILAFDYINELISKRIEEKQRQKLFIKADFDESISPLMVYWDILYSHLTDEYMKVFTVTLNLERICDDLQVHRSPASSEVLVDFRVAIEMFSQTRRYKILLADSTVPLQDQNEINNLIELLDAVTLTIRMSSINIWILRTLINHQKPSDWLPSTLPQSAQMDERLSPRHRFRHIG